MRKDSTIEFYLENKEEIDKEVKRLVPQFKELLDEGGIQYLMDSVYDLINRVFTHLKIDEVTTCSSGCNFCCYERIMVTSFEANYIANAVRQFEIPVNETVLKAQQSKKYNKLKYAERRCSLLNEKNQCSIYEIRPVICRLWNSMSDPKLCESKGGYNKTKTARTTLTHAAMLALQYLDVKENNDKKFYSLYDTLGQF